MGAQYAPGNLAALLRDRQRLNEMAMAGEITPRMLQLLRDASLVDEPPAGLPPDHVANDRPDQLDPQVAQLLNDNPERLRELAEWGQVTPRMMWLLMNKDLVGTTVTARSCDVSDVLADASNPSKSSYDVFVDTFLNPDRAAGGDCDKKTNNNHHHHQHACLPDAIMLKIMSFMDPRTLARASLVGRFWRAAVNSDFVHSVWTRTPVEITRNTHHIPAYARHVVLTPQSKQSLVVDVMMCRAPSQFIHTLDATNVHLSQQDAAKLTQHLPSLRTLVLAVNGGHYPRPIHGAHTTDHAVAGRPLDPAILTYLTNLTSLDLGGQRSDIDDVLCAEGLGRLTGLTKLSLRGAGIRRAVAHLSSLTGLLDLDLSHSVRVQARHMLRLSTLTQLQRLDVSHCCIGDEGLAHLGSLANLTELKAAGDTNGLSAHSLLTASAHLTALAALDLSDIRLDNAEAPSLLGTLVDMSALRSLRLVQTVPEGPAIAQTLGRLTRLTALQATLPEGPGTHLSRLTNLVTLEVFSPPAGTEQTNAMELLPRLRSLAIAPSSGLRVPEKGPVALTQLRLTSRCEASTLSFLSHLTGLRHLDLGSCVADDEHDAMDKHLAPLKALTRLDAARCDLAAPTARSLSALTNLRALDVSGNEVFSLAGATAHLTMLTELKLASCGLGDCCDLAKLTALRVLDLSHNAGVGDDLSPLGGLHALEDLDIQCCGLTDIQKLRPLAGLANLTHIRLDGGELTRASSSDRVRGSKFMINSFKDC